MPASALCVPQHTGRAVRQYGIVRAVPRTQVEQLSVYYRGYASFPLLSLYRLFSHEQIKMGRPKEAKP